eukprot:COSAG06_NODE_67745_length_251_cov_0.677632_1_plen_32_part_01
MSMDMDVCFRAAASSAVALPVQCGCAGSTSAS